MAIAPMAFTIACWFAGAFLSGQQPTPPPLDRVSIVLGNIFVLENTNLFPNSFDM